MSWKPTRWRIVVHDQDRNESTGSTYYPWTAVPLRDDGTTIDPYADCTRDEAAAYTHGAGRGIGYTRAEARQAAEEHCRLATWGNVYAYDYTPPEWTGQA